MSVTVVNRGDSNVFEEGARVGVVILVFGWFCGSILHLAEKNWW